MKLIRHRGKILFGACVAIALFTLTPYTAFPSFTLSTPSLTPARAAPACGADDPFCLNAAAQFGGLTAGEGQAPSAAVAVGRLVRILISLVGVLFFALILWGGFQMMIARGNTEEIDKAKRTLENATVGLIVVVLAYGLTTYVVSNIFKEAPPSSTSSGTAAPQTCLGLGGYCLTAQGEQCAYNHQVTNTSDCGNFFCCVPQQPTGPSCASLNGTCQLSLPCPNNLTPLSAGDCAVCCPNPPPPL